MSAIDTAAASPAAPAAQRRQVVTREYLVEVALLVAAYYGAAKLAQTLRYTASVSAVWPPAGVGMVWLYFRGLGLWPGVFIGELIINGQLVLGDSPLPAASVAGQQLGNMLEVICGAWLLWRLIGPRAELDRASQVAGMIVAAGTATGISATVGTVSMLATDVIGVDAVPTFWRTWWLGDTCGALIVIGVALTWRKPRRAFARVGTPEGVLMLATVAALSTVAVTNTAPLTYLIFPALIWCAFRFPPAAAALAIVINAAVTVGLTADSVGAFFQQPISNRTLSTQLYVLTTSLTALFLSSVVSERERSDVQLADARRRVAHRALEERRRIARDLHDSVSQALFSTVLQIRTAQKELAAGIDRAKLGGRLDAAAELAKRAQQETRRFIFEWGPEGVADGLVATLKRYATSVDGAPELRIDVRGPEARLPLSSVTESHLYAISREALANVAKHSGADTVVVRVATHPGRVTIEIADNGHGFDTDAARPGHYGLESMRSRALESGGEFRIWSSADRGTVIRVDVDADSDGERGDA